MLHSPDMPGRQFSARWMCVSSTRCLAAMVMMVRGVDHYTADECLHLKLAPQHRFTVHCCVKILEILRDTNKQWSM
jgi:hypothetical protein